MDQQTEALRELQRKFVSKEEAFETLKTAFVELLSEACKYKQAKGGNNLQQFRSEWMEKAGL